MIAPTFPGEKVDKEPVIFFDVEIKSMFKYTENDKVQLQNKALPWKLKPYRTTNYSNKVFNNPIMQT